MDGDLSWADLNLEQHLRAFRRKYYGINRTALSDIQGCGYHVLSFAAIAARCGNLGDVGIRKGDVLFRRACELTVQLFANERLACCHLMDGFQALATKGEAPRRAPPQRFPEIPPRGQGSRPQGPKLRC